MPRDTRKQLQAIFDFVPGDHLTVPTFITVVPTINKRAPMQVHCCAVLNSPRALAHVTTIHGHEHLRLHREEKLNVSAVSLVIF